MCNVMLESARLRIAAVEVEVGDVLFFADGPCAEVAPHIVTDLLGGGDDIYVYFGQRVRYYALGTLITVTRWQERGALAVDEGVAA